MKVTFITTILNEEETIERLLISLKNQTKKPDEIIIVDGGSRDKTVSKIKRFLSTWRGLKVIIKQGNRSVGRNEAIHHAKNEIIVCSDSGNILDKHWISNITKPFEEETIDVVAGYYKSAGGTVFQKCVVPYALVMEDKVDAKTFLPATRSIAFTKSIWKKVGGFNEELSHNEDYAFARTLKKNKARISFARNAIVYWIPRKTVKQAFIMMYRFALGDAEANLWRPKVFLVFLRYIVAIILFIIAYYDVSKIALFSLILLSMFYVIWAIAKNYRHVRDRKALVYLPLLQLTADAAVLSGTMTGLYRSFRKSIKLMLVKY